MSVFTNAGEHIQHFPSGRFCVLHAVCGHERQAMCERKIDQFAIDAVFAANEMPLKFNENVFAPERIAKKLRTVFCILGSTACQPVVCGSLPQTWDETTRVWRTCIRQAAGRYRLAACAPQKNHQSFRELRQLTPTHCAFT